jgi:hypothetical protein
VSAIRASHTQKLAFGILLMLTLTFAVNPARLVVPAVRELHGLTLAEAIARIAAARAATPG